MPRIGKPAPKVAARTTKPASKPAAKAKTTKPAAKPAKPKTQDRIEFPRANWKDPAKLTGAIDRARDRLGIGENPRTRHTKPDVVGGHPTRPPVVARYGVVRPPVNPPKQPVVARYGVIRPPVNPPKPPVVARYGVVRPPVNPPKPPVVARYGVVRPPVDDGHKPPKPPVVARYGVVRPPSNGNVR
jgi:hypothetical protein